MSEVSFLFLYDLMLGALWLPSMITCYGLLWVVYGNVSVSFNITRME